VYTLVRWNSSQSKRQLYAYQVREYRTLGQKNQASGFVCLFLNANLIFTGGQINSLKR